MKEQYGEYEIRYDEDSGRFTAFKGNESIASSAKLSDLKKRLDRVGEVRAKFQRFKVLSLARGGRHDEERAGIVEWEVTSIVQRDEVWVSNGVDRKKTRLNASHYEAFYADTPENRQALEGVVTLYKQREALDKRIGMDLALVKRASVPTGAETEAG